MNILFSSDDNYARHLGVAIYSIIAHNTQAEMIRFYVINNRISQENLEKLALVVDSSKNASIFFIPFVGFENQHKLSMEWPISLSSYARLLIGEMLPLELNRVIYLDCDIVVNGSLEKLWESDLNGNFIGAIQDTIPSKTKSAVGLLPHNPYFNAGVLLIDLQQWRKHKIGEKCMAFIALHKGNVIHHDQGVLNGVLKGHWTKLPMEYNVMTIHYMMPQLKVKKYFKDEAVFYGDEEVKFAIQNPTILHFTPSFTTRPWEMNCSHPMREYYKQALDHTPWNNYPLVKDKSPWYVHILNLRYRFFPIV